MAEEARQKYDLDMASYRQAGFSQAQQGQGDGASTTTAATVSVSQAGVTYTTGNYAGLL